MTVSNNNVCTAPFPTDRKIEKINNHTRGAVLNTNKWNQNAEITVRFIGGAPELHDRVEKVAKEWTNIAGLTFNFIDEGDADIRISFIQDNRSWSYIGTDCHRIPQSQATMNFGWLTPDSPDDILQAVVLHEFGHAIGMIHEHQNPLGGIKWNMDAVKHDLSGPPNNWDAQTIENNMFKAYPKDQVTGTEVDSTSIMMYPIPKSWTLNDFSAGFNKDLSDTDRQFIATVYPR
jgi:hypothetical protein